MKLSIDEILIKCFSPRPTVVTYLRVRPHNLTICWKLWSSWSATQYCTC